MATRAIQQLQNGVMQKYTIGSGNTIVEGEAVIFDGADDTIDVAGSASDLAIGVAMAGGTAGDTIEVMLFGYAVARVLCATGDATRGTKQKLVSGRFTDAPADNGATTSVPTYGIALQSAVAGDHFGLLLCPGNRTTT
jgi:hypothetical protein